MCPSFIDFLFLTLGPVELVPMEPTRFHFCLVSGITPLGIMILFHLIIIPVILLKMRLDPIFDDKLGFRSGSGFVILFLIVIFSPSRVLGAYDTRLVIAPGEFYPAPTAEAEFPHPVSPPPPPPDIPELAQPLLPDYYRRQELAIGLGVQFLGRHNTFADLTEEMEILEMRMLLEKRIEAALSSDGYRAQTIIFKRFEIRDVLFYRRDGQPFSSQTLRRYLSQIATNGTRGSLPYRKVVNAILW